MLQGGRPRAGSSAQRTRWVPGMCGDASLADTCVNYTARSLFAKFPGGRGTGGRVLGHADALSDALLARHAVEADGDSLPESPASRPKSENTVILRERLAENLRSRWCHRAVTMDSPPTSACAGVVRSWAPSWFDVQPAAPQRGASHPGPRAAREHRNASVRRARWCGHHVVEVVNLGSLGPHKSWRSSRVSTRTERVHHRVAPHNIASSGEYARFLLFFSEVRFRVS